MSLKGERGARNFNKRIPVGTPVRYYQIAGGAGDFTETKTCSEAWPLGSGHVVVKIEGRAGGVSTDHVFALPANTSGPEAREAGPPVPANPSAP